MSLASGRAVSKVLELLLAGVHHPQEERRKGMTRREIKMEWIREWRESSFKQFLVDLTAAGG